MLFRQLLLALVLCVIGCRSVQNTTSFTVSEVMGQPVKYETRYEVKFSR